MLKSSLLKMLEESKYTVVLSGVGMVLENGYSTLRDSDDSYEIEEKYGYSVDELYCSALFNTRPGLFFEFYRNEILSQIDIPPGDGYKFLAQMEKDGLVDAVITRRVFALPERAGCKNVVNLHGTVYDNYCPSCERTFPVSYIRESKKVPLCPDCNTTVRPKVCLLGEMVDNAQMTRAAEEVEKADVLLALGTNLHTPLCNQMIQYYDGDKLILITKNKHFSDKAADYVIYSRVDEALKTLLYK
ncbi:SIR2 family NAD-dependent protein deacylase [Hespellia stercorisuis]|uniref:protein acetyllysine N-acetyltransferase n=1 Tax=Hespellia stercorisuis DSM 15480 TaxID=1121950 RepID=A0A1M6M100_9FIRM|nr:Sir2 family NAD-dependent protein deacetylase [Hespellia stercorisuis]SHJ76973.1 NAD-dependent deacetylase [Hespellia stercorisuis DSM 15480]